MTPEQVAFTIIVAYALGFFVIVAGGVAFFRSDPIFMKTRNRMSLVVIFAATGAMFIGGVGVHLTGSSNTTFLKGQLASASQCELEGETAHPSARGGNTGVISRHIVSCMAAAGYDWTIDASLCQQAPIATNGYCYAPKAWFNKAITIAQLAFN